MSGDTRLAVEKILSDDAKYKGILDAVKTPISAGAEQISDEVAKSYLAETFRFTVAP